MVITPPGAPTDDDDDYDGDGGNDEMWDRYYNAYVHVFVFLSQGPSLILFTIHSGTATLIIIICALIGIGAFVFRRKYLNTKKNAGQPIKAVDYESNELCVHTTF